MKSTARVTRYASMLSALGHEARLLILRALFSVYPEGLVVGAIQEKVGVPPSTLSHHLDILARHGLIEKRREGTFLRYTAAASALQELVEFLLADCCRAAIPASALVRRKES
jgi:ArsR family transcriptional regulator, arsenate/arsenite/antimonite-responsive transcriptional repressor